VVIERVNNIKMDVTEKRRGSMDWTELLLDRDQWRVFL
jgi:hypothetical protein